MSERGPVDLGLFDAADALSPRKAASELTARLLSGQRLLLLNASSGQGKTVVALQAWRIMVDSGAFAIHVTHQDVETSVSLTEAMERGLRRRYPHLAAGCGRIALDLASHQPLLVLVEDVNRAIRPVAALQKVVLWQRQETAQGLRVLCPVWPRAVASLPEQESKAVAQYVSWLELPSHGEAFAIAAAHAADQGHDPSTLPLDIIVTRLNRDPLLLGLHDYNADAADGVRAFVEREATRVASTTGLAGADLLEAMDALAAGMLRSRLLEPTWRETRDWVGSEKASWLLRLAESGAVLRLGGEGARERIIFRHDRVRDQIRTSELRRILEECDADPTDLLIEPAYAELWGAVLAEPEAPADWIARASDLNPLGLFQGIALTTPESPRRAELLSAATRWLRRPEALGEQHAHLRWGAQHALIEVEDPRVMELLPLFQETTWMTREIACWNGDMEAVVKMTMSWDPYRLAGREQRVFHHLRAKHSGSARAFVETALREPQATEDRKIALLAVAGRLGDRSLTAVLTETWRDGPRSPDFINATLWAAAYCEPDLILEILDAWAELGESPLEHGRTPRGSVGYDMRFGFWATANRRVLDALLVRIRDPNDPLAFYVGNLIEGWDDPDAQEAYVRLLAHRLARARETGGYGLTGYHVGEMWAEQGFRSGHVMSEASLARLTDLWLAVDQDPDVRTVALRLWGHAARPRHLAAVRNSPALNPLGPLALDAVRALIFLDDASAPAALDRLIEADPACAYMFQYVRGRWRAAYLPVLVRILDRRRLLKADGSDARFRADHALPDLMMELDDAARTRLLDDHWDHLHEDSKYIELALWIATPGSLQLAKQCLDAGDPRAILQFISMHYNLYSNSQPPTTELRRLTALELWLECLDNSALTQLEEHCNRQGWHEWRRTHVDPRLEPAEHASWRTTASRRGAFDRAANEDRARRHIHFEFQRMIGSVGDMRAVLNEVDTWLADRRDLPALNTACDFVIEANSRAELPRLEAWRALEIPSGNPAIDDAIFAVRRRTLS